MDTPVTACPKVSAAIPPVRMSREVSTPEFRRRWKRLFRSRKLVSRAFATFIFLLLPAPNADPSDVTRRARRSSNPGAAMMIARPMRTEDAQQTHLVLDNRMRSIVVTITRY